MAQTAPARPRSKRRRETELIAEHLYSRHRDHLLAIARRNSNSGDDAEEALQDAFVLFIDHFDPTDEAPPLAWLTLTLKRRCWALGRRRKVRTRDAEDSPVQRRVDNVPDRRHRPDEMAELKDTVAEVRARMARLKPDERKALALLSAGYSYREIGERFGWTYTKVNRCIREGRATLRDRD